jgi:hypothetical protein
MKGGGQLLQQPWRCRDTAWLVSKIGTPVVLFEVWAWNVHIQCKEVVHDVTRIGVFAP